MRTVPRRSLLLILPVLLLLMGARAVALANPDPIAIPANVPAEQIAKDIKRAMINRGWTVSAESDGRIDATLNLRAHVARVAITWDGKQVAIGYVSSENLKYEEKKGQPLIHKNYLSWVNNLASDISANLQLSSL